MAGILLGRTAPGREAAALAFLGAVLAAACFLAARHRKEAARIGAVLAFFLLGTLFLGPYKPLDFPPGHVAAFADGSSIRLAGIVSDPIEDRPEFLRFELESESVIIDGKALPAAGRVRVSAYENRPSVKPGDRIVFTARLRRIRSFRNPGSFDYAARMAAKDILVSATLGKKSRPLIFEGASGQGGFFSSMRRDIAKSAGRAAPGEGGDVLAALVAGDGSRISRDLRQKFADAGTSHLLAVSGLHIGLAAGFAFFVMNWLLGFFPGLAQTGKARRAALVMAVVPAVLYGLLAGMSPSTQRAVVMVGALFLSFSARKIGRAHV